jgi:hypothetical protein
MKNFRVILLCLFVAFFSSSCSSLNQTDFYNNLSRSSVYLKSSSSYITSVVLAQEKSEETRAKIARVIYDISFTIENLTVEDDITPESFAAIISRYVPEGSSLNDFAVNIILLYADFYSQTNQLEANTKARILLTALNKISAGCKIASNKYLIE